MKQNRNTLVSPYFIGLIIVAAVLGGITGGRVVYMINGRSSSPEPQQSVASSVKKVSDAVVTIRARSESKASLNQERIGCGVAFSSDGYIVTNEHLVAGATEIKVKIDNGTELVAKVIGTDKANDLAVIKVDSKLSAADLGSSESVAVGDDVIVIGKPFTYSSDYTVTKGVVSAIPKNLPKGFPELMQTDATINPGNSGGPICDNKGRVIGITTAYLSTGESASGIGFAVPIDIAKRVFDKLTKKK